MKKLFITAMAVAGLYFADAQTLTTPQPSPTQTVKQNFGLSSIELTYSRPGMKGRKIFGDLVPFEKVWRTGANNATIITFADDVTIGGTKVKAGKYGLVTIPDKRKWIVIISKQLDITSPAAYKKEEDVARVEVKTMEMGESMETFTIQFADIKPSSCELHIMWDKTAVAVPISTEIDKRVTDQIDQVMNKDNRPYFSAAMYYMDSGKDLNQALAWFDKAVELQPDAFFIHHQRANCLAKLGKKEEARTAAKRSIELATIAKNDDYVKLNEKLLAELAN